MKTSTLLVALCLVALLHGCGYHLRGHSPAARAADDYSVHVSAAGALAELVKSQLAASGVQVTDGIRGADYVLTLSGEQVERRVASVSSETGKVEEYLIIFTVRLSISDADGKDLALGQLIRATGDYAFDKDAALGKFAEEETIREELAEQAAAQIVRRLNALAGKG